MWRLLTRHRGFLFLAVGVLATAVGANLLVFAVVNALWLRPLPFANPESVVTVPEAALTGLDQPVLQAFSGAVAGQVITADRYSGLRPRLQISEAGRDLEVLGVTPGYFELLGVEIKGRGFSGADALPGAEPVAVISDALWKSAFQASPGIVGSVIGTTGAPIRIVGVAAEGFTGARRGERADVWIPHTLVTRMLPAGIEWPKPLLMIFARLGPGETALEVQKRYRSLMDARDREWFEQHDPGGLPRVVPLGQVFGTPDARTLVLDDAGLSVIIAGLSLLVLLGGCATVAALVLVHLERRRTEFALKTALGASQARLARELSGDFAKVGILGAVGGLGLTAVGMKFVPTLTLPDGVDLARLDLVVDWRVAAVALVATVVTVVAASIVPVIRSTRPRVAGELVAGLSSKTATSQRIRKGLLVAQVACAVVVLVSAGLFVRTLQHGFRRGAGFETDRVVFVSIQEGTPEANTQINARSVIEERSRRLSSMLAEIPGVAGVAEGISPLGAEARVGSPKTIRLGDRQQQLLIGRLSGGPALLSTLGVPLIAGRHLTAADASGLPVPVVITQSLAEAIWREPVRALGEVFSIAEGRAGPFQVVGISGNLAFGSLTDTNSGVVVTAQGGTSAVVSNFALRTDHPEIVAETVRRTVRGQVVRVSTGAEVVTRDLGRQRLGAFFLSGFGFVALILGVGGAFGLVSYLAASQRREFAIRLSLGASPGNLVWTAMNAAVGPVLIGIVLGTMASAAIAQLFSSLLVGVATVDLATYSTVAVMFTSAAVFATLLAAWNLRRVNAADGVRAS